MLVYPGFIASQIKKLLNMTGVPADQHQSNGGYAIHQLRVRLPGDPTVYRVVIAPAEAPLRVGTLPIDQHFLERMIDDPQHISEPVANVMASIYEQRQAGGRISDPRDCDSAPDHQNEGAKTDTVGNRQTTHGRSPDAGGGGSSSPATGAAE